jgi:hypothetical protein
MERKTELDLYDFGVEVDIEQTKGVKRPQRKKRD